MSHATLSLMPGAWSGPDRVSATVSAATTTTPSGAVVWPVRRARNERGYHSRTLALAVRPDDPRTLFAGTSACGLWVSHDGAASWSLVPTGQQAWAVGAVALHPRCGDVVYVGTGEVFERRRRVVWGLHSVATRGNFGFGILASADGGETWRRSWIREPEDCTAVLDLAVVPDPGDSAMYTVWAATTEGVLRLRARVGQVPGDEEGDPWECVLGVAMATSVSPHPERPHLVLAACGSHGSPGHGIYLTADGGASWKKTRGVPKGLLGRVELGRSSTCPDVVYATVDSKPQSETVADRGGESRTPGRTFGFRLPPFEPVNWVLAFDAPDRRWRLCARTRFTGARSWYSRHLTVDPRDPERVYLGGVSALLPFQRGRLFGPGGGVYRIVTEHTGVVFTADVHQVAVDPADPEVVYFAGDQGVFKSLDAGRSFLPRDLRSHLYA